MTRGVLIFGINNARVEYIRLALMAAAFVKNNMGRATQICLVTDDFSIAQYRHGEGYTSEFNKWIDDVVLIDSSGDNVNTRTYRDTQYYSFKDNFKNTSRVSAYELSPYDETLLIDCDYLVLNDSLNAVWDSVEELMVNKHAVTLMHQEMDPEEIRLNPYGIRMYWATVVYFKKCEKAKLLFDLIQHIKENWEFYKNTYNFPGHLYRNDYAFSIAIHMLNGFTEDDFVVNLPHQTILTALDLDQFYGISDKRTLHFFMNDKKESWKYFATKISGINVHCMNKLSLLNSQQIIMETLND